MKSTSLSRLFAGRRFRWLPIATLLVLLLTAPAVAATPGAQVRVARQFLLAVLRADYAQAYALLAPEVRRAVPPARFELAARPLYQQGQQRGPTIDLYRLGLRLSETDQSRLFYAFMFRSDTATSIPQVQLDVTFRDSAATQILEFRLLPAPVKR
ncbi:hypothetical protein [Hymenobacter sp. B81]|uniref:hypothetical protein n=1 Tax=Hymenobacter sp. B81 TaxID=3344878 RepID=UPI0037DBFE50